MGFFHVFGVCRGEWRERKNAPNYLQVWMHACLSGSVRARATNHVIKIKSRKHTKRKSNQLLCYHNYLTQQNLWIIQFIKMSKCLLVLRIHIAEWANRSECVCKWDRVKYRMAWRKPNCTARSKIGLKWISAVTVQCQSPAHSTINLCRKHHAMVSSIGISRYRATTSVANMCSVVLCWDHIIF